MLNRGIEHGRNQDGRVEQNFHSCNEHVGRFLKVKLGFAAQPLGILPLGDIPAKDENKENEAGIFHNRDIGFATMPQSFAHQPIAFSRMSPDSDFVLLHSNNREQTSLAA
ncbi:MAG: hypothetical protein KIS77_12135 [Saprospiraceae bacterium]|nr:hypothetical protein [Saprospiraceae bacterium]